MEEKSLREEVVKQIRASVSAFTPEASSVPAEGSVSVLKAKA